MTAMDKRFTSKDFVLLSALSILLLVLLLVMYQVDRQWTKMEQMTRVMSEQAQDLRTLRGAMQSVERRLRDGVAVSGAAGGGQTDVDEVPAAFRRAIAASEKDDFQTGDALVLAFGTGLKTLTPTISTDAYSSEVQSYVLESLLVRDPDTLQWQGLIARDWEYSVDGLTITFRLHEGVTFSDGMPLTAEDIAFTFAFIMNDAIAAPRDRAYLEKVESVTATGPYEVAFRFNEPYFNSLQLAGSMAIMARHFYEPFLERPEDFNQSRGLLFGSGPYRLPDPRGWTPDQGRVELERNPRYWGPVQPPFDRVMWRVIENDAARLTTFRNREIDVYGASPREYQRLLDDRDLRARTHHFEYMAPTAGYNYIGWNQERNGAPTRFADRRVRQAMTLLTDQQRIIDEIMLGFAEAAVSPFSPRSPQHDPALVPRPFDAGKALALLKEAGFEDRNGDGVLQGPDGQSFDFELVFFQDNEDTRRIVLFLRDLYARVGIVLRPKPTEWSVMLDLINRKDFDAITLGWTSNVEIDIFQMFHSTQTMAGGDNFVHYRNPEFDRLVDQARAEVDVDARMPLWHAAERILYEDQPYTFLMRRKTLAFLDRRLHNLEITNLGLNMSRVPVEIYVPGPLQKYSR